MFLKYLSVHLILHPQKWCIFQVVVLHARMESFISIVSCETPRIFEVLIVNTNIYSCGESTYNLTDAQVIRVKLLKLAESIDSLR